MKRARIYLISFFLITVCYVFHSFGQSNWEQVFFDDFEDGASDGWELTIDEPGAAWDIFDDNGNYVLRGRNHNWARLQNDEAWSDYSFKSKIKIVNGGLHINYRVYDEGRYFVAFNQEGIFLYKHLSSQDPIDLGVHYENFEQNTWYSIEIIGVDNHIKIYVNEQIKLEYIDNDPINMGSIAFETNPSSEVLIDNIEVERKPLPKPPPGYVWKRTGGPRGGLGYDIRIHPHDKNILFVTDNPSGVNKSYDGGKTWFPKNDGITVRSGFSGDGAPIFSLTIDPGNPDIIWCGTQNAKGIFKSIDCGETWLKMDRGVIEGDELSFRGFAIHPNNSDIVISAGEITTLESGTNFGKVKGVIYKTINGGESWYAVWRGDDLARVVIFDPLNPSTIYCSTGLFDREAYNSDAENNEPGGYGVLKSIDGGETWFVINNGLNNPYVGFLEMHPNDPLILYASTKNLTFTSQSGLYMTTNGGASWEYIFIDITVEGIGVATISSSTPRVVYAFSEEACFRSDDGGMAWERLDYAPNQWGIKGVPAGHSISAVVDPYDPMKVFVNSYGGGNIVTEDGGKSWQDASNGYTGNFTKAISMNKQNPKWVYTAGRSGIYVSYRGGDDWEGITNLSHLFEGRAICAFPDNPSEVLAASFFKQIVGGHYFIYKSINAGKSWYETNFNSTTDISQLAGTHDFKVIEISYSNPNIAYAGIVGGLTTIDPSPEESFGVLKSTDRGESWIEVNVGLESSKKSIHAIAINPQNPDIVYIGTGLDGIYKTTNGGKSWFRASNGLGSTSILSLEIDPKNPETIFAGSNEGKGIFKSINSGELWEEKNNGITLKCPNYLLPIGKTPIGMSLEKPKKYFNNIYGYIPWTRITDIEIDPTNSQTIYAADIGSGVYLSQDGGNSWVLIDQGLLMRDVTCLDISSDGTILYAGTMGNGVYRLVLGKNKAPQITSFYPTNEDTVIILEDQSKEFRLDAFDFNEDQLFYQWELNGILISDAVSSSYVFTTQQLEEGSYHLKATVTDQTEFVEVAWLIRYKVNDAPVVKLIPDITFNEDDSASIDLDLYVSDEEDDTTHISWSYGKISNKDSLLITIDPSNHELTLKAVPNWFGGPIDVFLTAIDQGGKTNSDTIVVTVLPVNDAPQFISVPDFVAIEDSLYTYNAFANDVDKDTVKYSLTVFPKGMTINDINGLIQWLPTNENVGDTIVVCQAYDG
jgi:photosystem II stability/assembly factor-like uncharacterized protein